jgi:hypothetical protein
MGIHDGDAVSPVAGCRSVPADVHSVSWNALPALVYRSSDLEVVVLPERGGKIASLRDKAGREWLEQPLLPLPDLSKISPVFIEGDMCGWDECGPTISPCQLGDLILPDHGELWSQAWRQDSEGWLTARGRQRDYEFGRRLSIAGSKIVLDYRVAAGNETLPFLWAAHPQFRVDVGTEIILPDHVTQIVDVLAGPSLPRLPVNELRHLAFTPTNACRKFYAEPESDVHEVSLLHGDGSRLTLTWTQALPYLGIWIDRSVYARHDVVALEPSTGFYDSCEEAVCRAKVLVLRPFTNICWSVIVAISPRSASPS